ncbi:CPBP family intramembrane glutamic endopeptidase [Porphyromonas sp.]
MMTGTNTQLKASIYTLLVLFALFLLLQLLLGGLYMLVSPEALSSPSSLEPLLLITGLSFIAPPLLLPQGRAAFALLRLPRLSRTEAWHCLIASAAILALAFAVDELEFRLFSWLGWELKDEATELILQAIASGKSRLELIPYISLLPAFAEELFFRGAVQSTLERLAPKRPRLVWGLTSVLFALMHLSVLGFVTRSLLGYGFSYLCSRTQSLWPGIALHALNNLIVLYLL